MTLNREYHSARSAVRSLPVEFRCQDHGVRSGLGILLITGAVVMMVISAGLVVVTGMSMGGGSFVIPFFVLAIAIWLLSAWTIKRGWTLLRSPSR